MTTTGASLRSAVAIARRVRSANSTRLGRPVSASVSASRRLASACAPARWTASSGSASSGTIASDELTARTASGARPSRTPSFAVWRISSLENSSRMRDPDVSAMTVDTEPVLMTKYTPAARSAATSWPKPKSPSRGGSASSWKTTPLTPMVSMYWPMLKAQWTRRFLWMRSARVLATACVRAAAPMPPNSSRPNANVVDGTISPSPRPSLTGRTSPAMTATAKMTTGSSKWRKRFGPSKSTRPARMPKPDAMIAPM